MNELALFASAFGTVFALGFQQQNVVHRHYRAAALTSFVIGSCQIFLWRTLPDANTIEIITTLAGGPVGIVAAMWLHPILLKQRPDKTGKVAAPDKWAAPPDQDKRERFIRSLLDPEGFGWSVSHEVRTAAREALK